MNGRDCGPSRAAPCCARCAATGRATSCTPGRARCRADARKPAQCAALERINARIDDGVRFERHNIRGKDRMTARVALALAVMMALALGSIRARAHDRMRSLVRPPPAQAA